MTSRKMDILAIPRPPALPPPLFPIGPPQLSVKPSNPPPKPPPPPPPKTGPAFQKLAKTSHVQKNEPGFRLISEEKGEDDSGSVYSLYKQKIDSMFDSDASNSGNTLQRNTVQAKIEKMFSDVAKDEGVDVSKIGIHSFTVDYLGSVTLQDKVTSLAGLQGPLKELYFPYKITTKNKKVLSGRLEISNQGLKVQYQGEKGDLEQMNPFPTIAVWSAVKFVISEDSNGSSYAFLPLITDPDNLDKHMLFKKFQDNESKYITNEETHSPLFAVIMRKIGVHKQLECHGFVCQTSEDAIVIAATLYKSLMSHMKANENKKPKQRNGVTCMSIASSIYGDKNNERLPPAPPARPPRRRRSNASSITSEIENMNISDTQPLLQSEQKKVPKKSIKEKKAPKPPCNQDLDAILPYEDPANTNQNEQIVEAKPTFTEKIHTIMSKEQKQITEEIKMMMSENSHKGLKKMQSVSSRHQDTLRKSENVGDILTKVAIPRSGSFLNAQGLTRYKSKVVKKNGQASGGSPLGFNELFNEFRLQEGLHSMDDILGVIIDSEGMSFNDLKPIYKEFLLKLAVTLTKDELYQRSKMIMRRQKKKLLRKTNRQTHRLKMRSKIKQLKHVFKKKLRRKTSRKNQLVEVSSVNGKMPESTISSSSYDTRQFLPKNQPSPKVQKRQSYRKKGSEMKRRRERASTSEESDFMSIRRNKNPTMVNGNQNRNSSSGYVSCSDCSYDSDSCTCVSADKCYCSLGNNNRKFPSNCRLKSGKSTKCYCSDNTLTFCGCDTDSCAESNKCYCAKPQIKSRRAPKLDRAERLHKNLCKKKSTTKSVQSLEYMSNPHEAFYEKPRSRPASFGHSIGYSSVYSARNLPKFPNGSLPVDYDLFVANEDFRRLPNAAEGNGRSSRMGSQRSKYMGQGVANTSQDLQKVVEIASLFSEMNVGNIPAKNTSSLYGANSRIVSNNFYNKFKGNASIPSRTMAYADMIINYQSPDYGMIQNVLYRKGSLQKNSTNGKMFNTKNALYTIQSQSDESRRSLRMSARKPKDILEYQYLNCNNHLDRNSLEDSLGYLP